MNNIEVIRDADFSLNVLFKYSDGNPIDLTGSTVFLTVKKRTDLLYSNDDKAIIKIEQTNHFDPIGGQTNLSADSEEMNVAAGSYEYDIKIVSPIETIGEMLMKKALFEIVQNVTQRSS